MKIILGLGNPGRQYENTRHNVGFAVVDAIAQQYSGEWRQAGSGQWLQAEIQVAEQPVLLVKPQTFMNLSGEAAKSLVQKHHPGLGDVWVVHDELDLPLGRLQWKVGGSSAGHNGVQSIIDSLGSPDFVRLRLGLGISPKPEHFDGAAFVLQSFTRDEQTTADDMITAAAEAIANAVTNGIEKSMQKTNTKNAPDPGA